MHVSALGIYCYTTYMYIYECALKTSVMDSRALLVMMNGTIMAVMGVLTMVGRVGQEGGGNESTPSDRPKEGGGGGGVRRGTVVEVVVVGEVERERLHPGLSQGLQVHQTRRSQCLRVSNLHFSIPPS